ncbi:MAG TPA: TlpA disulfide reductase family protein [Polyangiales bacterium]|nr:TlpA disulfide reductase family protein [Polyangiales bacterium]
MTTATTPSAPKAGQRELFATILVLCIGAPLLFIFARAMSEAELRRREAPLRAMLGDQSYEALERGEKTELHYLGDGLLAPDFEVKDKNGKPWRLKDQRGKLVIMNFWSVTCQPCVEEMPSLVTLAEILKHRKDIELVAISTDKDWATAGTIFPPNSRLKVLFDPQRSVTKDKFGTKLYPETWVIDSGGVVRMRVDGPRDWGSALSLEAIERFL